MAITRIGTGTGGFGANASREERRRAFRRRFAIGERLEGVVTGVEDARELVYRVSVEGLEVAAVTPFPVRFGQRLAMRVEALEPDILLRCLRLVGDGRNFDLGAYFAARKKAEEGEETATDEVEALQRAFVERLAAPVVWKHLPAQTLDNGVRLRNREAASWTEPGVELYRCIACGTAESALVAPVRFFLEGQAKSPFFSYTLHADANAKELGERAQNMVEEALVEAVKETLPAPVRETRRLARKTGMSAFAEVASYLAAKLG